MHILPRDHELPVNHLPGIFRSVTNSYKYYWFLAILSFVKQGKGRIFTYDELALQMLNDVWYPLNYFRLSFGKSDGFKPLAVKVKEKLSDEETHEKFPLASDAFRALSAEEQQGIIQSVLKLVRYVPYRFQRPFVAEETQGLTDSKVDQQIKIAAAVKYAHSGVMYRYLDRGIELHPAWHHYLRKHFRILKGFICWELTRFLQQHNPNVPGITEKLFRPENRKLTQASGYWKSYLDYHPDARCIYSGRKLASGKLSIDHFIPWRFVVHDQLWNLVPTLPEVNSSKSDRLPNLNNYLYEHAQLQRNAFQYAFYYDYNRQKKKLETYAILFNEELARISDFSEEEFHNRLSARIKPLYQTANNMGFDGGWGY